MIVLLIHPGDTIKCLFTPGVIIAVPKNLLSSTSSTVPAIIPTRQSYNRANIFGECVDTEATLHKSGKFPSAEEVNSLLSESLHRDWNIFSAIRRRAVILDQIHSSQDRRNARDFGEICRNSSAYCPLVDAVGHVTPNIQIENVNFKNACRMEIRLIRARRTFTILFPG
ncbi:hypothetical protein Aduo_003865 [Ancylostoma duodenale]